MKEFRKKDSSKEQEKEKHVKFETQVNWCLVVQRNVIRNPPSYELNPAKKERRKQK